MPKLRPSDNEIEIRNELYEMFDGARMLKIGNVMQYLGIKSYNIAHEMLSDVPTYLNGKHYRTNDVAKMIASTKEIV